jgi:hypothetical protein
MKKDNASLDAEQLKKKTEIKTRFWTNKITGDESFERDERALLAWLKRMSGNGPQDVKTSQPFPFAMTVDANEVIGRELVKCGIVLPSGREMDKYLDQKLKRSPGRKDIYDA